MKVSFNGKDYGVQFSRYSNGRPAIMLVGPDGECAAVATVNIAEAQLLPDQVFIKVYSENEGMLAALEKAGIVKATGAYIHCGHVSMPVCKVLIESPGHEKADKRGSRPRRKSRDMDFER